MTTDKMMRTIGRNSGAVLFLMAVFGTLVGLVGLMRVIGHTDCTRFPAFTGIIGWWVLAIGGCVASIGMIGSIVHGRYWQFAENYKAWFSYELPLTHWERVIQQPGVNRVLQERAKAFDVACQAKAKFTAALDARSDSVTSDSVVTGNLEKLRQLEDTIAAMKMRFWMPHALARRAGLRTFPKFSDYLFPRE